MTDPKNKPGQNPAPAIPVDKSGIDDRVPEAEEKKKAFKQGNRDDSTTAGKTKEEIAEEGIVNRDNQVLNEEEQGKITNKK